MGMSKTEVNFWRLLAPAPQQQNHSKLIHYVATLRELLEQLAEERTPEGLPRPTSSIKDRMQDSTEAYTSAPVKLDAAAEAHIQKHKKLQEDLTDEMVGLARQLKESSLMMSRSLENAEKILDSTKKAVENSFASTGHANVRAMKILFRNL